MYTLPPGSDACVTSATVWIGPSAGRISCNCATASAGRSIEYADLSILPEAHASNCARAISCTRADGTAAEGACDGEAVGLGVGTGVGLGVGTGVGLGVGTGVGFGVGAGVGFGVGFGAGGATVLAAGLGLGAGDGVDLDR